MRNLISTIQIGKNCDGIYHATVTTEYSRAVFAATNFMTAFQQASKYVFDVVKMAETIAKLDELTKEQAG